MHPVKFQRIILLTLIGLLMVMLVWVLSAGIDPRTVLPSSKGLISKADIVMDNFSLKQVRNGLVEWDIKAEQAELFEERDEVSLSAIQATLQTAEGLRVSFSGDRGLLNTGTHDFEIKKNEGDLNVSMNNGYTIQASSLTWKDRQREIVSEQPIRIIGQGLRIRGDQLIIKLENQQLIINGDVHVTEEP
jgi:LPS export ABC transporter protein LptC